MSDIVKVERYINEDGEERIRWDSTSFFVPIRAPFAYDSDGVSRETGLACEDASRTQQQFVEDSDINTIVNRFHLTGVIPQNVKMPMDGDFTAAADSYQSALDLVMQAEDAFMQFPAETRDRFGNNPQKMIDFCSDPKNRDEAKKLGLLVPEVVEAPPMRVRVVPDPAP